MSISHSCLYNTTSFAKKSSTAMACAACVADQQLTACQARHIFRTDKQTIRVLGRPHACT